MRSSQYLGAVLLTAVSLSIGWGVRGNFGHEYGAMIPGALAAIAVVLMSGREDWIRRVHYFAMFGALGWAFGGSISYMRVIAYTHSGHLPSQVYGFACLFVIGFSWGALGGAGTALPAVLDRQKLTQFFGPVLTVLVVWIAQDIVVARIEQLENSDQRHLSVLYWYDTDWLAALTALVAMIVYAAARRRIDWGTSFILHMAVGWWIGFLVVVVLDGIGIEFRMTPPRGDNWAGVLGMIGGALVFFLRRGLQPLAHATLVTGFFGGFGFATATFLKLVEVKYVPEILSRLFHESTWQTNWHSVLEQTYGFLNGVGVAVAMLYLARRLPKTSDEPRTGRWTEVAAVGFVLLGVTYVNLAKNIPKWIKEQAIPKELYGIPTWQWHLAGFLILSIVVLGLLWRHLQRPIALVPTNAIGRGQLLYLVFLWWIIVGNLERAIPPFHEQRLITEGVIFVNAVLATTMILLWPKVGSLPDLEGTTISGGKLVSVLITGLVGMALTVAVESWGVRLIHGDKFVGHAGYLTRFGPDAETGKPDRTKVHP